jgi:RNA polymerase sigma-70 factor (ECF subfamily)
MHEKIHSTEALLRQLAEGEEEALATLVRLHWRNVYAQALLWIKSTEEAEEVTQDIFLKLWNTRSQIGDVSHFENWLFIVSRNTIVSAVRKKLSRPTFVEEQEAEEHTLRPDRIAEHREQYQVLLTGVSLLPGKRQQVFRMSRFEGLTHEEIAERLGIHKDTVAQYIVKAVAFLKSYLQEHTGSSIWVILLLAGLY